MPLNKETTPINFLHNSVWITKSLLVFCENLLLSLIMWLTVSSLLLHNYTCYFAASNQFLLERSLSLWLCFVLLEEILVSLFRFPFYSDVQIFSCEVLLF